jgi:hypothetical protein
VLRVALCLWLGDNIVILSMVKRAHLLFLMGGLLEQVILGQVLGIVQVPCEKSAKLEERKTVSTFSIASAEEEN